MNQPLATATELVLPDDWNVETWQEYGRYLKDCTSALSLWKADWLNYGRGRYEQQDFEAGQAQLELDLPTMQKVELLGGIPPQLRQEGLQDAHYVAAAKRCTSDAERAEWLKIAADEGLSARELQASIRAKKVVRCDDVSWKVSAPSPYAVKSEFRAWREAIGDSWEEWSREDKDAVADALVDVAAFWRELKS